MKGKHSDEVPTPSRSNDSIRPAPIDCKELFRVDYIEERKGATRDGQDCDRDEDGSDESIDPIE